MFRRGFPFILVLLLTGADQLTKSFIKEYLTHPIKLTPFAQLVYVQNKGAAFGMLQGLGNTTFIFISLVAIIFIVYMLLKQKESSYVLATILAGALGNLIDRIRFGYVIDFIDLHIGSYHWPAFNIADSCLSIGLALLFIQLFFFRPQSKKEII